MALFEFDRKRISGNVRIVYENYPVSSYKLSKMYGNPVYKKIIDFLASVVTYSKVKENCDVIIPLLEEIRPKDLEMLCYLEHRHKLENFLALVRVGAKGV